MHDSEKVYRKHKALNNSLLGCGTLEETRKYHSPEEREKNKDKEHFRKGLYTDCMLLTPECLEEDHIIAKDVNEYSHPAILIKEWIDRGHKAWNSVAMEIISNEPLYKDAKLWGNTKDTVKRIENFDKPEWHDYFNLKLGTKNWITEKEKIIIDNGVNRLTTNIVTAKYFSNIEDGFEHINQMYVVAELELTVAIEDTFGILATMPERYIVEDGVCTKVFIKGLFDKVRIDHTNKKIKPADLKTSSKPVAENFSLKSFLDYGYFKQGAIYTYLLKIWAKENYPDYTIEPFEFVVVNLADSKEDPEVFVVDEETLKFGMSGGTLFGKYYKGIIRLCEEYARQEATGQWYLTPYQFEQKQNDNKLTIKLPVSLDLNYTA